MNKKRLLAISLAIMAVFSLFAVFSVLGGVFDHSRNEVTESVSRSQDVYADPVNNTRTWEKVTILAVMNFTRVEKLELPVLNVSIEMVQVFHVARVNSSVIRTISLKSYLPAGSLLVLLFEDGVLVDYLLLEV